MITAVIFDIDGVLTDGGVYIDQAGCESKAYNITELDALHDLKRMGFRLAAITGEDTPIVNIFRTKAPWDQFISGCKDKLAALKELEMEFNITREEICYIGDGKYDVPAIEYAGIGICPRNAVSNAKSAANIILKESGGGHCVSELLLLLKEMRSDGENTESSFSKYLDNGLTSHLRTFESMKNSPLLRKEITQAAVIVLQAVRSGRAVYLCGNGGSAADAQHIATEFVSRFYQERPAFNAESLTVNTSSLTAIGNDYAFERVFARQLEAKGRPGDILIGISTSGASKNVLKAMEYAAQNGMHTILLTGAREREYAGGVYECVVKVPSEDTPRIQEGHIFIGHMIAEYVEAMMARDCSIS